MNSITRNRVLVVLAACALGLLLFKGVAPSAGFPAGGKQYGVVLTKGLAGLRTDKEEYYVAGDIIGNTSCSPFQLEKALKWLSTSGGGWRLHSVVHDMPPMGFGPGTEGWVIIVER